MNYRVRRATLDDIAPLMAIWSSMRFDAEELAKRITDFQVAEGPQGIVGAIAMEMAERQGRIHSEGFTDFALADQLRPLLWERIHALATNHGLLRLWTDEQAPFWCHCGLNKPDPEALQKLPAAWRQGAHDWLTLKLREDVAILASVDQEFALFMASEKQRTERAMQQAKVLKVIATLVALALFGMVLAAAFFIFRRNPGLLRH